MASLLRLSGRTPLFSPKRASKVYTLANGDKYEGEVNRKGERHGKGIYIFADGDLYEGSFVNGKFHGIGELRKANGDVFLGYCTLNNSFSSTYSAF